MSEATFWEGSRCTNTIDLHNWTRWTDIAVWFGRVEEQERYCGRCGRLEERYVDE